MYSFGSASQADSQLARVLHICPDTDTSLSLFPECKVRASSTLNTSPLLTRTQGLMHQ